MKKLFGISLIFIVFLCLEACKKPTPLAPGPPFISFANFTTSNGGNAVFTFNFTDPDGDIGLNQSDTIGAFAPGNLYYYDFYMRYYYYSPTKALYSSFYYPLTPKDTLVNNGYYTYRIPYITDNIPSKALNGQVIVNLNAYKPSTQYNDSLSNFKYEFWIYDRALHKSNVVTTPVFMTKY